MKEKYGKNLRFTMIKGEFIMLYTESKWKELTDKLKNIPVTDDAYETVTLVQSLTYMPEFDAQNRAVLPFKLRGLAGITKNITSVFFEDYVQIWDADKFNERIGGKDANSVKAKLGALKGFGI